MTGIAIVLYLNQYPNQPRERDYAFAGSFYAFAIWIGIGVAGLWALIKQAITSSQKTKNATSVSEDENDSSAKSIIPMAIAVLVGIALPLQMVSQTWDDHDRSGRYVARDFGMNYLSSLDENAIIFTNGDNDTFPLWYAQEVEGYRTDVRVVNLSYLSQDWYAKQQLYPSYDAPAIAMQAKPEQYMLNRFSFAYLVPKATESNAVSKFRYPEIDSINTNTDAVAALNLFYKEQPLLTFIHPELGRPYELPYPYITSDLSIPVNVDVATQKGRIGRDYIYDEEVFESMKENGETVDMNNIKKSMFEYLLEKARESSQEEEQSIIHNYTLEQLLEYVSTLKEDSENMQYYRNAQKVDLAILKGILKRYRERERETLNRKRDNNNERIHPHTAHQWQRSIRHYPFHPLLHRARSSIRTHCLGYH